MVPRHQVPDENFVLRLFVVLGLLIASTRSQAGEPRYRLSDMIDGSGIGFRHVSPPSQKAHVHLLFGAGVGWADYDRDGWPDVFFTQGQGWAGVKEWRDPDHSNRLYRNRGDGSFADVTQDAGLIDSFYGMGLSAGDYNNDGFPDLYVTSFSRNRCYRNNGDGTFSEVAQQTGTAEERYSSSCTWSDIDADGNLDLYVINYLKIDPNAYPICPKDIDGQRIYRICHPRDLQAEYDVLYHNEGDGRFTDVSERAGLTREPPRQGLGIITADLDRDGDADFYVANDTVPNHLWINQGNGTFLDDGMISGSALNRKGQRESGMGVAVGDVDGDGRFDLFVTHYYNETNTLYRNEGEGFFLDATNEFGLAGPSRLRLSFGTLLCDVDNDGFLDMFIASGHIEYNLHKLGVDHPFAQLPQLYLNQSGKRFHDISAESGPYFTRPRVGRGCAAADYDRDGRLDLVVNHLNDRPALLHNQTTPVGNTLRVELVGTRSNRDGIAAVVEVHAGERKLVRTRTAAISYLSCNEHRFSIGVGRVTELDRVVVHWPGGRRESWQSVSTGVLVHLIEGTGLPE